MANGFVTNDPYWAKLARNIERKVRGEDPMTNYDSLAAVRNEYDSRLAQIQNNDELPEKAKHRKIAELKNEARDALESTLKQLERSDDAKLRAAFKDANPAPDYSKLTVGEVQARQEIIQDLDELGQLEGAGDRILDMYADFMVRDYRLGCDVIADRGRKYLNAEQAKELQQLEDQRKPALAQLRKEYDKLAAQQDSDKMGRSLMADNLRTSTQLTPEESDALARSQAAQSTPATAQAGDSSPAS